MQAKSYLTAGRVSDVKVGKTRAVCLCYNIDINNHIYLKRQSKIKYSTF